MDVRNINTALGLFRDLQAIAKALGTEGGITPTQLSVHFNWLDDTDNGRGQLTLMLEPDDYEFILSRRRQQIEGQLREWGVSFEDALTEVTKPDTE